MASSDKLTDMESDIKALRAWTGRHEERHGDDADMLALVLSDLTKHTTNHHGRTSEIKRGASIITILAVLAGVVEVVRQLFI